MEEALNLKITRFFGPSGKVLRYTHNTKSNKSPSYPQQTFNLINVGHKLSTDLEVTGVTYIQLVPAIIRQQQHFCLY
jgi:hypothetical protein